MLNTCVPVNSKHHIYQYGFSLNVSVVCLCSLGSSISGDVFFEEWGGGRVGGGVGVQKAQRQNCAVQY